MSPVNFIFHNDTKILLMDFTNSRTTADIAQTVEEIKKTVELQRHQFLVALLDVTGIPLNREKIRIIQAMASHNRPYVRFIVLMGLGFPRSIVFKVMLWIRGKKTHRPQGVRYKPYFSRFKGIAGVIED